ncbi:hypothetical protein [Nocardia sp. NPDC051750]
MAHGGFEVIVEARRRNAADRQRELDEEVELREGIPVGLWRALPDSPG